MTILQALDGYYHRLAEKGEVSGPGWSMEKFGWCIVIGADGAVIDVADARDTTGKKPVLRQYRVPASFKRPGTTPRSFFLWDKTAFCLGVTKSKDSKGWEISQGQHHAFKRLHFERLATTQDDGLRAFKKFLEIWQPEYFGRPPFVAEMLDANIMFRFEGDSNYLHFRPAARALVETATIPSIEATSIVCLVTGQRGYAARLHPSIKGVEGAQSSGADLVSFNRTAFESYGKEQGDNAPTSEAAVFHYGTALNHLLTRDGPNRIQRPIGDATTVFWADASTAQSINAEAADAADAWFGELLAGNITDESQAAQVRETMEAVVRGRPVAELVPAIEQDTRFHVLGLSPNAARLSVRYWLSDSLDHFARALAQHHADLAIDPLPYKWPVAPSVNLLLAKSTALQEKFENIPHQLAGDMMRAVLTGTRYPQTLLAAAIMRLRAGDDPLSGWHVAVIRAVLTRDYRFRYQKEDVPVSLSKDEPNKAYQLGRLFAVLETAQRLALGKINATIRDRYFGAASATPASVFPLLLRGAQNHLGKLRKDGKGGWIEREIEDILDLLSLDLPRSMPLAEQGRFAIGYYHQRKQQFKGRPEVAAEIEQLETTDEGEDA